MYWYDSVLSSICFLSSVSCIVHLGGRSRSLFPKTRWLLFQYRLVLVLCPNRLFYPRSPTTFLLSLRLWRFLFRGLLLLCLYWQFGCTFSPRCRYRMRICTKHCKALLLVVLNWNSCSLRLLLFASVLFLNLQTLYYRVSYNGYMLFGILLLTLLLYSWNGCLTSPCISLQKLAFFGRCCIGSAYIWQVLLVPLVWLQSIPKPYISVHRSSVKVSVTLATYGRLLLPLSLLIPPSPFRLRILSYLPTYLTCYCWVSYYFVFSFCLYFLWFFVFVWKRFPDVFVKLFWVDVVCVFITTYYLCCSKW